MIWRPMADGSPLNFRSQNACDNMTRSGLFGESSSAVKRRPTAGCTRRIGSRPSVTSIDGTRSGSPVPVIATAEVCQMAVSSKVRLVSR